MMSETLLPNNATAQETALEQSTARLSDVPVPIGDLWNPQTCPAAVLPWLAWAFSVDAWSPAWSLAQKLGAIAASLEVHRRKGTRGAVNSALAGIGYSATVTEWWEQAPVAAPYTFAARVTVEQEPLPTLAIYLSIVDVIESVKNARSHFDGIEIEAVSRGGEFFAAAMVLGETVHLNAEPV
jgi:phage tail P2-like protein